MKLAEGGLPSGLGTLPSPDLPRVLEVKNVCVSIEIKSQNATAANNARTIVVTRLSIILR